MEPKTVEVHEDFNVPQIANVLRCVCGAEFAKWKFTINSACWNACPKCGRLLRLRYEMQAHVEVGEIQGEVKDA